MLDSAMLQRLIPIAFLAVLAAPVVCRSAPAPPVPGRMAALIHEYEADVSGIRRAFDLDWSETASRRMAQLLDQWLERLEAEPFEEFSQDDRIEWLLLRNAIRRTRSALALEAARLEEMDHLLPFRRVIQQLEESRWQGNPVDPAAAAENLTALVDPLNTLRESLAPKPEGTGNGNESGDRPATSPVTALRAAGAVSRIRGQLSHWFRFYDGYQPEFSWWVRQPYSRLDAALETYAKFLREEMAGQKGNPDDPLVGDPIGAGPLAEEIAAELIPYSAEDLLAIADREFAWCGELMREAARELGCGDDTAAALTRVKSAYVPPGEQDDLAVAEVRRAIEFLRRHDLVTIPPLCEEIWRVEMIDPQTQRFLPYAAYSYPAIQVAYAREDMPHEDKLMAMRGNNRHFMRIVTPHEVIPGHHLQRFAARRSRPWRGIFSTPFLVEGWALHWEMLLWDLGYAESAADRAGMLFWRMHRCARILLSLRFHLGRISPQEMVDFLVTRVGHERMAATSEVRRWIGDQYGPLYQAAYMIGGLQLRALHRELTSSGGWSHRAFHDAILGQNAIPIELIRAALTNSPLTRDWRSSWRF